MANTEVLMQHYADRRADLQSKIEAIHGLAFSRGDGDREFNDTELDQLNVLNDELAKLNRSIETATKVNQLSGAALEAVRSGRIAGDNETHEYKREADALWDIFHRSNDQGAKYRWERHLQRAAQHMGTTAAATTPVAGGFDGLIVPANTGPIIRLFPSGMPFLTLIGAQQAPTPGVFLRPRIVDPDFATGVAPQALQKGELASKKFDVKSEMVNLETIGGYLNLSLQAQDWLPGALDLTISQLRARLENALDVATVAEADKTGSVIDLPADADAVAVQAAVWDAMTAVYKATKQSATWLAAGPDGMALLGKTVDLAGRPLFPVQGPANALGTADGYSIISPFGLRFAVADAITDSSIYVGNSFGLEAYIYRFPLLQAVEPSLLGNQIAVAAGLGFYSPITTEAGPSDTPPAARNGIAKIEVA